jgi:hypothetical protein
MAKFGLSSTETVTLPTPLQQFEEVIVEWDYKPMGLVQGEYSYLLDIRSPFVKIELRSSVNSTGKCRGTGEDSIRAWMVDAKSGKSLGGKVQTYVKRTKNWRINLGRMIRQMIKLAAWIQPCPICETLLRLAVRKADKEVFLFCPEDANNRTNKEHERHLKLHIIAWEDGSLIRAVDPSEGEEETEEGEAEEKRHCPTCQMELIKVNIQKGANAGKKAWSCPAKKGGKFLNHVFEVID